jgi:hypothetical protein
MQFQRARLESRGCCVDRLRPPERRLMAGRRGILAWCQNPDKARGMAYSISSLAVARCDLWDSYTKSFGHLEIDQR